MGTKDDLGPAVIAVTIVSIILTTIAVSLRGYVRLRIQRRFLSDDYLVLFSLLSFYAFAICIICQVHYGIGKHKPTLSKKRLVTAMMWWWYAQHAFILATYSVKISVAIFFCSLGPPKRLRRAAIATAWIIVITEIGFLTFKLFRCWPIAFFWKQYTGHYAGQCLSRSKSFIIMQVINTFDIGTDVILATLPCLMVWNMNMRRIEKVGVSILLGLGVLAAITSIIRAFYFHGMILNVADQTYAAAPAIVTMVVEPAIALIVVGVAQLRPLVRRYFPKGSSADVDTPSSPHVVTIGRLARRQHDTTDIWFSEVVDESMSRMGQDDLTCARLEAALLKS